MRKYIAVIGAIAASLAVAACGQPPDQRVCQDVPKLERAITQAGARADVTEELLGDVAERAAEARCPGFENSLETD